MSLETDTKINVEELVDLSLEIPCQMNWCGSPCSNPASKRMIYEVPCPTSRAINGCEECVGTQLNYIALGSTVWCWEKTHVANLLRVIAL